MKLIPKQQAGGSFVSLFADYTPLTVQQETTSSKSSSSSSSKSSDEDKGKLTEKDLFTLLKDVDGLPNEMKALVKNIQRMYQNASILGDDIDAASIANLYAKNIYQIKNANFNKQEYDQAKKNAEDNGGLNEIAITANGHVIVQDENKELKEITVDDYLGNLDKYSPMTNSNILWYRAHDPSLVGDKETIQIASNGIGLNKVDELIRQKISSLGTTESTQEGYVSKVGQKVQQGLEVISNAKDIIDTRGLTMDGLYKTKAISKDQNEQMQYALKYIYQMLPTNAKTLLKIKSGNSENPDKGAMEMIFNLLSSKASSTQSVSVDYQSDLNIDGSKKKSSSSKDDDPGSLDKLELSGPELFLAGYGNKQMFTINAGSNDAINTMGTTLPLTDGSGKNLGTMCSLQEVSEGQYGGILDWSNVTMAGRRVKGDHLKQVLVQDGNITSMDFPVDANGNPDLRPTTIEAVQKAKQIMKQQGIDFDNKESVGKNAAKVNAILAQCNIPGQYDAQGNPVSQNWKRFAVMNGTTDGKALNVDDLDDTPTYLQEVEDDNDVDNIIEILHEKSGLAANQQYNFEKKGWFSSGDRIFKGTIWIPIQENYFNARVSAGSKITGARSVELERQQQLASMYVKPSE